MSSPDLCSAADGPRTTFSKLHDVWGDLDGDAHKATMPEFMSQMANYDGSEVELPELIPTVSAASKDETILHVPRRGGRIFSV